MKDQKIFIFGNEDLKDDNLPFRILPELKRKFPEIEFIIKDPNEEWDIPAKLVIIDTATGIKKITVFENLDSFSKIPRMGVHDFDALTNLRYLQKLGKIKKLKIIALPSDMVKAESAKIVCEIIEEIFCN